jgi:hypothetical protein
MTIIIRSSKFFCRFLNRVQVENLPVENLIGITLFTSSLKLAFETDYIREPASEFAGSSELATYG